MKKLMFGAATMVLAAACAQGEAPAEVTIAEPTLKELTVRAGDPAEAADALAAMALGESGSGVLSFAGSTTDGADATFTDLTIDGLEGLNVGSLVFEGLEMDGETASFGKMSFSDIVIAPEDEDVDVKLSSIELINPSPELAAWLAASLNGQQLPFPAADKVSFDSWTMSDLSGDFADTEAEGTFSLDKIEIRDLTELNAAKAVFSGLNFSAFNEAEDERVDVKLGSVTATNLDGKFIAAIQDNIGDEDAMAAALMAAASENPMEPGYDSFDMSDFVVDAMGVNFALPSLVAGVERNAAGQPVKFVTEPYTMKLKADAEGGEAGEQLLQALSVVGYEELELKGASVGTYDPDKDMFSFDAAGNYFELTDGAKFNMGGKIEGYSGYAREAAAAFNMEDLAAGAEPDPMAMTAALGQLTFHNIELSIADMSLVDRTFNAVATAQGADPAALKAQASAMLAAAPMMAGGTGIDGALIAEATTALGSFINNGGTLTLKMEPADPLSVASIMENPDPSAYTKDALGFTATQN